MRVCNVCLWPIKRRSRSAKQNKKSATIKVTEIRLHSHAAPWLADSITELNKHTGVPNKVNDIVFSTQSLPCRFISFQMAVKPQFGFLIFETFSYVFMRFIVSYTLHVTQIRVRLRAHICSSVKSVVSYLGCYTRPRLRLGLVSPFTVDRFFDFMKLGSCKDVLA